MYFIPRNNKMYSFLVTIPQHSWYGFTFGVLIALGVSWWCFLYLPAERVVMQLKAEYEELVQYQASLSSASADLDRLTQEITKLSSIIEKRAQLFGSHNATLHLLITQVIDAGLSLRSCIPGKAKRKGWYIVHPVELQMRGSFSALEKFFKAVALRERIVRFTNIQVNQGHDVLDIRCTVVLIEVTHDVL